MEAWIRESTSLLLKHYHTGRCTGYLFSGAFGLRLSQQTEVARAVMVCW